jgi:glycerol-3-phosphate dehydrogenase
MNHLPRQQTISQLTADVLDVLVIGGGIVGAGVARDAAMRGLRVGLVEQADFAAGTSSRSSRLLHGGIRYLAQGRVKLVREASKEKTLLGRIAPHLAEPLPFIFPTRRGTPWSHWKLSMGVKLYDLLCGLRNFGRSSRLNVRQTVEMLPGISTDDLTGAVRYFDALTNDARLVIDTLRSASRNGAIVVNYMQFIDANRDGDQWVCPLRDTETNAELEIRTHVIVNAAGPWSDRLPHSRTKLRLTKGVHLVVDRRRLPVPEAIVMAQGERIMFAIPWGERVILGTTDTDYDGDIANPPCDAGDVAQILVVVNNIFPEARLMTNDVISTWSGLRPLVADPHGKPSDISRRHKIEMSSPGWWDITGGKLTTYRLMAEETIDQITGFLNRDVEACRTADLPLLTTDESLAAIGVLPPEVSQSCVVNACRNEWARHIEDVMIRRTSWRYYHRDHEELAAKVADWMANELGWDAERKRVELDRYSSANQCHPEGASATERSGLLSNTTSDPSKV